MKAKLLVLVFIACASPAFAQEKLTLPAPIAQTAIADYQVDEIRISRGAWTLFVMLKPTPGSNAPQVWCQWGGQTRTVSTPNAPINGVAQPDTVVSTPNVGVSCSNGYSNINAPTNAADMPTLLKTLNKANLAGAGGTLEKRAYDQFRLDGVFAGTVTGTPQ